MFVETCEGGSSPGVTPALNGVCPYYTMFPLSFPLSRLGGLEPGALVLDPFCGRGTTLLAARMLGLRCMGVDANPVAVAISRAKVSDVAPGDVMDLARRILAGADADPVPEGEFWEWAYAPGTLDGILRLRAGLREADGPVADALRAVVLGALHGPRPRHVEGYLSNQMQRTFAPKPAYAVRYWRERGMRPREVDVAAVLAARAARCLGKAWGPAGSVIPGDVRVVDLPGGPVAMTVTSPPYFGMRTYVPDQWLRNWFVGGPSEPSYRNPDQIALGTAESFAGELSRVWRRVAEVTVGGGRLVVRFGAIGSRRSDPESLLLASLAYPGSPWRVEAVEHAGDATLGKRQAAHMGARAGGGSAAAEVDVTCRLG